MRIAMVGTRGVPARYGGFETCVEEVGTRLADAGHEVTVYCRRRRESDDPTTHRGMTLVHLPALRRRSLETLSHSALSVGHLLRRPVDAVLLFNAANAPLLPVLRARRLPVATHVDGLEWKRGKWGRMGQRYYRTAEALAVRWSDTLIADAAGIQDYYRREFDVATELIAYGAPIVPRRDPSMLAPLDLEPRRYHLVVARFEPENHVDVIVEGYVQSSATAPLVVVGSAPYADAYTARLHALADERVRFLGALWDQELLDQLYANALTYQHGHSVGGTNPSLLRAIGAGAPSNAFDVSFNREVLDAAGRFWSTPAEVAALIEAAEADGLETLARGRIGRRRATLYDWDDVANGYEMLCHRLATRASKGRRATGRRTGQPVQVHDPAASAHEPIDLRDQPPVTTSAQQPIDLQDTPSRTRARM
jgi:glycosyltransferase involved in cell wall biosynthesis